MLSSHENSKFILSLVTALSTLGLAAGCSGPGDVSGGVELVDRTKEALTSGQMASLNGTYGAGCAERSGPWSIEIANGATLAHPVLSVIKNDPTCALTVTSLVADTTTYAANPSMLLGGSYHVAASSFADAGAGGSPPVAFYANTKMNPTNFSADFVVTFLYSDDANAASGSNNATYDEWQASVSGDPVTAPNYTYEDNLAVKTDVDSIVTTALGTLDFTDGTITGEKYLVDLDTLPSSPTFDDIDSTFTGGSPTSISAADPSIGVSAFSLMGETLPVIRTVLIQHEENGVASYQTLKVTFNAP